MSASPVYLDYAATTPVAPEVAARMAECLTREGTFGNPGSASHAYGEAASACVEAARAQVAAAIGAQAADVVFTSGATEANNLAIFGTAQYYKDAGRHIVTARTEHKSVLDPCKELERRGWDVTYLVPGADGTLDPARVAAAVRPDTVLVSIMHVNNETGVIADVGGIAALCARAGNARIHVDAAQSVGKCEVDFAALGVDLLSVSAHKAYGPKGAGALLVSRRRGAHLMPILYGGGQESGLRSGTVATHQAVGMGAAFELASAAGGPSTGASRHSASACGARSARWAAWYATAPRRHACRTCSMCRSTASRARACSRRCSRISPCPRGPPAPRPRKNLPMCCALWAGTIGWRRAVCASVSGVSRARPISTRPRRS